MTLLRDIQDAAIDAAIPLSDLLRKCLVLAHRLSHEEFASWANMELDGYPSESDLPDYRHCRAGAYGDFLGVMHTQRNHVVIPPGTLEGAHRSYAEVINFRARIGEYEAVRESAAKGGLAIPWPGDLVLYYQTRLLRGWNLTTARQEVPLGAIAGLLDAIRTRVLRFALELESAAAASGSAEAVAPEQVRALFQNIIMGDNNTVAIMSPGAVVGRDISIGDWQSLALHLHTLGIPDEEIAGLNQAIAADRLDGSDGPGPAVHSWYGGLAAKAAGGSVAIATSVVGSAVWQAIMAYFGSG